MEDFKAALGEEQGEWECLWLESLLNGIVDIQ